MTRSAHSRWLPLVVAIVATLSALVLRIQVAPDLFDKATFMPFFMAILLSAWYGGLVPGLLATTLGAAAIDWFLLQPEGSFLINSFDGRLRLVLYSTLGIAISIACESLHAARRGAAVMRTDITELQSMEENLRTLAAELSEADHRKNLFLATLSHELRNPLAPIRNGLELIRRSNGDVIAIERARLVVERQVAQMVRLVDDLLDVSRITRDKLELRRETVLMDEIIDDAVSAVTPLLEQHGHRLEISLPDQPVYLDVDPTRATQVLGNLLNNAAKYTDNGGSIQLSARVEAGDVVVTVRDNGIGVPAGTVPKMLEMFGQADQTLERAKGGLGIGLGLAKRLVEMHGGRIEMRSEGAGLGTEVEVRLPAATSPAVDRPAPPVPEPPPASPGGTRRKVLVVDDNVDSVRTLAMMLDILGHDTRMANDGLEAVETANAFQPDLILLDIGMPKLNGYEACRRIREQAWACNVTIIAVSGWGQDEDRARSDEAGFDRHLVKPLDPEDVERLIAGLAPPAVS